MAPPKKMSLEEFFKDDSYGGSWADDDIDMASICVPIERGNSLNSPYSGDSSYGHGHGHGHGGGGNNFYGGSGGGGRQSNTYDSGPPYIVKLLNLPITSDDSFVEDLFRSRFTKFVKFKIVVDPSSNILETHVIHKVSFVELSSFQDLSKVLKWQDVVYGGHRRVNIEMADFNDFKYCLQFNQQHAEEIERIQEEFVANKNSGGRTGHDEPRGSFSGRFQNNEGGHYGAHGPTRTFRRTSDVSSHFPLHAAHPATDTHDVPSAPPKPKPNPFGAAKPVDTLTIQQEIEKKIHVLHPDEGTSPRLRRSSINARRPSNVEGRAPAVSILKRSDEKSSAEKAPAKAISPEKAPTQAATKKVATTQEAKSQPQQDSPVEEKLSTPTPPPNVYETNGKSLAELLSQKPDKLHVPVSRRARNQKPVAPKPAVIKPVILKKKVQTASPSPPNSELFAKEEEPNQLPAVLSSSAPAIVQTTEEHTVKSEDLVVAEKENEQNKPDSAKGSVTESSEAADRTASLPHERVVDEDRPNFKKNFYEIVNRNTKEKRANNVKHSKYGNAYSSETHQHATSAEGINKNSETGEDLPDQGRIRPKGPPFNKSTAKPPFRKSKFKRGEDEGTEDGSKISREKEPRAFKERKDSYSKEPREPREPREPKDHKESREPRDVKETREPREPKEHREHKEHREPREPREHREAKEPRESKEPREPREGKAAREPKNKLAEVAVMSPAHEKAAALLQALDLHPDPSAKPRYSNGRDDESVSRFPRGGSRGRGGRGRGNGNYREGGYRGGRGGSRGGFNNSATRYKPDAEAENN